MTFDLARLLQERRGDRMALHTRLMNPQLARVLTTLGFDREYVRGEGCYLYDADGQRYLDLLSGFGVFALGRSHPVLKQALHDAIDADLPNMVQIDCALLPGLLAEALVARAHPGIERVVFCNSGTEAVEAAIKFARRATGRSRIVYCDHAFHGLSTGSLSLNGGADFRAGFGPLLPGTSAVPFGDIGALRRALSAKDVAAFVVEPIQGKGVHLAPEEYWQEAAELCRATGTLLVADEVQTGMGRTGQFFAYEHYGIAPDIITVSKALSGGYVPVGAMLCSDRVLRRVHSSIDRAMVHSSTFSRNQLAMVAGLATLQVFDDEDIVDRARRTGVAFEKALAPLVERHPLLHEVRGKGLMIGLVFGPPPAGPARRRFRAVEAIRTGLFSQLIVVPLFHRHRILTQVAADNVNVVKLLPPLVAGEDEVRAFVDALDDVLQSAMDGGLVMEVGRTVARSTLRRRAG
ncbi:MAG: aspartate aminotransferase family protein [Actinomycetota bacterium]|jgi:ornithine--oxo-acid transaminase|nr:aspartate aminotransferase family protein [Actinomycetota bacterium]MDA8280590.1 aspartate aminotransferase family protein [Actinomycetota bacterium]